MCLVNLSQSVDYRSGKESMASQSPGSSHIKCPFPSLIVSALCPAFHILCLCRVASQLDTLLAHLSRVMLQEGHRLKAWGFLDTGTGAELLQAGKRCLASSRTYGKEAPMLKLSPAFRMIGTSKTQVLP